MEFTKSVTEIIRARSSWRTYTSEILTDKLRSQIERIISLKSNLSPFNDLAGNTRFKLITLPELYPNKKLKIGTYGMIKGAQEFIVGAITKSKYDFEHYGYLFETIILAVTDLGLGTCWLGGTFNRSKISSLFELKDNEIIPAITPIGYPATRRWKERMIRSLAKSKIRKSWEELFFGGDFNTPLNRKSIGDYEIVLEMVRIGPSAGNKQPWRVLKDIKENNFHFFVKYSEDKKLSVYNQFVRLDVGIAVCHFDFCLKELGISGRWTIEPPNLEIPKNVKYTISWFED